VLQYYKTYHKFVTTHMTLVCTLYIRQ